MIRAESGNANAARASAARRSVVPAMRVKIRARESITPVRSKPALSTNMELITIGALLLKTVTRNCSSAGRDFCDNNAVSEARIP